MRIGTRGSALALWQARTVARLIHETGGPACEIVVIRTSGDEAQPGAPDRARQAPQASSARSERQGDCSSRRSKTRCSTAAIDLAVHSSKDLPGDAARRPRDLRAALEREDPRDALLLPVGERGAAVSTRVRSGPRPAPAHRHQQRAARRRSCARSFPEPTFVAIRGNVDTRLRKLDAGECDALVLAAAGVKRLGLEPSASRRCCPSMSAFPRPVRASSPSRSRRDCPRAVRDAVARISDADAETALTAERAVVRALGGGLPDAARRARHARWAATSTIRGVVSVA